jgi:ribosomal protein S18 acetylase RimI-like enzyme
MHLTVTNESSIARADEVVDFLRGPRLWIPQEQYPDFDDWLSRVHIQLKGEDKRAMLAIEKGRVIGAVVYQRHRTSPDILELKNISVRPEASGRCIASLLVRNAELEGMRDFPGVTGAIVDAKADNIGIRLFLLRHAYRVVGVEDLYGLNAGQDLVFRKPLGRLVST